MTAAEKLLVSHQLEEITELMSERDFQRDFFESLSDQFESKGFLSPKQRQALANIYERVTR